MVGIKIVDDAVEYMEKNNIKYKTIKDGEVNNIRLIWGDQWWILLKKKIGFI